MIHRQLHARFSVAVILAAALVGVLPAAALAHAEFERSSPEDGEVVEGSPNVIRAFFTEALGDGSEMALVDENGATVAEGGIDPADPSRMRIDPPDLGPGDYEVQWKAFADDGHLETGTFAFTVSAVITPPPASLEPTPSSPFTPEPSATVEPAPTDPATPSPTEGVPSDQAASDDAIIPIVAVIVLIGLLGGYLLLRRRPARP